MLSIWRERSSEFGIYDRVDEIELGTCGSGVQAPLVMGTNNVLSVLCHKVKGCQFNLEILLE